METLPAVKEIENISRLADRRRIVERISALAEDPRPPGSKKLSGLERYRLRQGPYRKIINGRILNFVPN